MKMRETSWRTLMLLTTLLVVFVIFQGTVRSLPPQTPLIGPAMGEAAPEDCNKPLDKPALSQPQPVMPVVAARRAWINNELVDLSKMGWASPDESDDPNGSSPPVPE